MKKLFLVVLLSPLSFAMEFKGNGVDIKPEIYIEKMKQNKNTYKEKAEKIKITLGKADFNAVKTHYGTEIARMETEYKKKNDDFLNKKTEIDNKKGT